VRRREAPPHTIWVLICPDTGDYIYINNPQIELRRKASQLYLGGVRSQKISIFDA